MRKRGNRSSRLHNGRMQFADFLPVSEQDRVRVGLEHYAALDNVIDGRGSDRDVRILAEALNTATALAENGIGHEELQLFELAQQMLVEACVDSRLAGQWMFNPSAKRAIADALNRHDDQLALSTVRDLKEAFVKIERLHRQGAFITVPVA